MNSHRKSVALWAVLAVALFALRGACATSPAGGAPWRFTFHHALPQWKDGLPVGNGRLGAQVWGTGTTLYLTLDRGDVWDLRYQPNTRKNFNYAHLQQLVHEGRHDLIQSEMSSDVGPLADITPTRLSIGRLKISLPAGTQVERAQLDMQHGEVRWQLRVLGKPVEYRVLASPDPDVILVTLDGVEGWKPEVSFSSLGELTPEVAGKLGYPKPTSGTNGRFAWSRQSLLSSGVVTTVWTSEQKGTEWNLLLTIPRQDDPKGLETAQQTLNAATAEGVAQLLSKQHEWWRERWSRSQVNLPDPGLERLWINGIYKLASSSYRSVPAGLQGLWPPDGELPPWRGDYHIDMNIQETYWPAYSSNQLDLAEPLNRWLVNTVAPQARKITRQFFGVPGIWVGGALDVKGRLLGGQSNWMTVQYWLGGGAWLAQHLWWYYAYSQDKQFLREQGYPFLKEAVLFYENILKPGPDGRLHIPLSASPEYFSNDLKAWTPDPTAGLSLVRSLLRYTIRASEVLGVDPQERTRWEGMEQKLASYPVGPSGLKVQPDAPYDRSHRHPMHLFPIFPGGDLNVEGSPADRELINKSIENWIYRGTGEWTGWSFPYASLIASRVRRRNQALNELEIYKQAFIWPNGFHVNGDYHRYGYSTHEYEPFTMEAECAFTAAVNGMLLQSWGGKVRIFPSVPEGWKNVSFENLRAQGGFLVSGEMVDGEIVSASIASPRGGEARVVFPLGYVAPGQPFTVRSFHLQSGARVQLLAR
ncbi:MAG TPA: glycoside hydrolase N-terminal domain-containing protein [Terriglobia bacterium]|nr:glycoside hydrolase N-terminal domain-containing protein [Terriglobia bacterium]